MKTTSVAGRTWHFSHVLGRITAEHNESEYGRTGGFAYPMDVAVANDDILFVLSRGLGYETAGYVGDIYCRIGKTTFDEDHIGDFARGGFTWPNSIALSNEGNVFCSDEYEHCIYVFETDKIYPFPEFEPGGESILEWGIKGSKPGQLNGPTGIDFDLKDQLYVVDSLNHRIQLFTKEGALLTSWGKEGRGNGEFNRPWGITVDSANNIYVADWGNNRVQKLSPDGAHIQTFGTTEDPAAALDHQSGVAVDTEGDVYVVDWGNNRVQIYGPDGEIITSLYGDATEFSKAGQYNLERDPESAKVFNRNEGLKLKSYLSKFGRPIGITIDKNNRIIITDGRGRLHVYVKDQEYVEPPV